MMQGGCFVEAYVSGDTSWIGACERPFIFCSAIARTDSGIRSSQAMASAGLNNMRAFGFALIDLSSEEALNSSITAVHAARCPPAEPPAAAIRLGSTPKFSAWERTHRIADFASSMQSSILTGCRDETRYSTVIATMPRFAKCSHCFSN